MWDLEALRARGASQDALDTALAATLVTRSAVSEPHAALALLCPALADAVDHAVQTTYDMDSAMDPARAKIDPADRAKAAKVAEVALRTRAAEVVWAKDLALPRTAKALTA
ncbi:hypothetical protein [Actinosynnema sp.]|uniref:hypothetical protein n=1 Tax=Actinosynnema sp. TaxID=1872144 RepID=UPI003F832D6D